MSGQGPAASSLGFVDERVLLRDLRIAARSVLGPGRRYVPSPAAEDAPRARRLRGLLSRHGATVRSWTLTEAGLVLVLDRVDAPALVVTSTIYKDAAARWACMLVALAELDADTRPEVLAVAAHLLSIGRAWTLYVPAAPV